MKAELPGEWGRSEDDYLQSEGAPSDLVDTPACHALDGYHLDDAQGDRVRADRIFWSDETAGLSIGFLSEIVPEGTSVASAADWVAGYYREAAFARCFADDAETRANGRRVTESRSVPGTTMMDVEGVAWLFTMEGEPSVLRSETYVWTSGRLILIFALFVPDDQADPRAVQDFVETFQRRVAKETARGD